MIQTTTFTIENHDPRIDGEWVFHTDIPLVQKRKARQEFELLTGLDLDKEQARAHDPSLTAIQQVASVVAGNASFLTFLAYLPHLFVSYNGTTEVDFDSMPEELRVALFNNFAVSKAVVMLGEQKKKLQQHYKALGAISLQSKKPIHRWILSRLKHFAIHSLANSPAPTDGR